MTTCFSPLGGIFSALAMLQIEQSDAVVHMRLNRPAKRNAISDEFLAEIQTAFVPLPASCRVVVLNSAGDHFCAGLISRKSWSAVWPRA